MKRFFILSILFMTVCSSCRYLSGKRIMGNGVIKSETRTAGSFSSIDVSGAIDVYVKQDSVSSIRIETDENLLEYIEITANENILSIKPRRHSNPRPTGKIKVFVSNPSFKHLEAAGACNIYSENKITDAATITIDLSGASDVKMELAAPVVDVDVSGAGSINLKGEARDFKAQGTGATNIYCYELMAENTTIELTGAGSAQVFASVKLDVHVSGAADVKYKGNPTVSQSVSGAGSVKKAD